MFSRWIADSGVSRGTSTSGRRSFSITSAARSIRLSASPRAIAPSVPICTGTRPSRRRGSSPTRSAPSSRRGRTRRAVRRARRSARRSSALRLARLRREREVAFLLRDDLRGRRVDEADASRRAASRHSSSRSPYGMPGSAGEGERDGARGHADDGMRHPDVADGRRVARADGVGCRTGGCARPTADPSSRWRRCTW